MAYIHDFPVNHDGNAVLDDRAGKTYFHHSRTPGWLSKRGLDIILSVAMFVVLLPLMLVLGLLVFLADGGSPIFKQSRVGLGGRKFNCLKFRSMVKDADQRLLAYLASNPEAAKEWAENQKLRNDPRITYIGHFLRRTSLDELPQLWNILKGDMSLVGPRPIVDDECPKYGDYLQYYHSVLPGVTGLWQVSGRSDTTYDERVLMDVEYANTHTTIGDMKILVQTVPAVLLSKGAY